jgi:hypothetical protein
MSKSLAVGSSTDARAGVRAGCSQAVRPTLFAQVRAAVARSRARGRMSLVSAEHLRTPTAAGSRLVRQRLTE